VKNDSANRSNAKNASPLFAKDGKKKSSGQLIVWQAGHKLQSHLSALTKPDWVRAGRTLGGTATPRPPH